MKSGRGSGKRRCNFRHFWKEMESLWLSISILLKASRPSSCILRQSKQCKEVHEQQQTISFGSIASCGKLIHKCSRNSASRSSLNLCFLQMDSLTARNRCNSWSTLMLLQTCFAWENERQDYACRHEPEGEVYQYGLPCEVLSCDGKWGYTLRIPYVVCLHCLWEARW